jgi:hypothetical protein
LTLDIPPGGVLLDELFRERTAAASFADVIECVCGRRWRAIPNGLVKSFV